MSWLTKSVYLSGCFAVASSALNAGQFPTAEGPDFHSARELRVLTVVVDESNRLWAPRAFPDPERLLGALASAQLRIANNAVTSERSIQMGIEIDGSHWFVNFPLPPPSGFRPYMFYVSGRRANQTGVPTYAVPPQDARTLGGILNALIKEQPPQ